MKSSNLDLWFLAQEYLRRYVAEGSNTQRAKRRDLIKFIGWLHDRHLSPTVATWTPGITQSFRDHELERGAAPSTVARNIATLSDFAHKLQAHRVIDNLPTTGVRVPGFVLPTPKRLTDEQLREIENALSSSSDKYQAVRNIALFVSQLATALRASELLSMKLQQFDGNSFINIRCKGNKFREIFCPRWAGLKVWEYLSVRPRGVVQALWLEKSSRGLRPMIYEDLQDVYQRVSDQVGFRVHAHLLRHTRAHQIMETTRDVRYVKELLGHASVNTSMRYLTLAQSDLEKVMEERRF